MDQPPSQGATANGSNPCGKCANNNEKRKESEKLRKEYKKKAEEYEQQEKEYDEMDQKLKELEKQKKLLNCKREELIKDKKDLDLAKKKIEKAANAQADEISKLAVWLKNEEMETSTLQEEIGKIKTDIEIMEVAYCKQKDEKRAEDTVKPNNLIVGRGIIGRREWENAQREKEATEDMKNALVDWMKLKQLFEEDEYILKQQEDMILQVLQLAEKDSEAEKIAKYELLRFCNSLSSFRDTIELNIRSEELGVVYEKLPLPDYPALSKEFSTIYQRDILSLLPELDHDGKKCMICLVVFLDEEFDTCNKCKKTVHSECRKRWDSTKTTTSNKDVETCVLCKKPWVN